MVNGAEVDRPDHERQTERRIRLRSEHDHQVPLQPDHQDILLRLYHMQRKNLRGKWPSDPEFRQHSIRRIGERIRTKTNSQPLSQKLYKLRKEKKERAKVEADDTLDKKAKKKQLSEHDKVIKDIEDSLKEVDGEFRLRLKNLRNAL